jgi:hypothetical protein
MRRKNVKRAATALFLSQGDDKNKELTKKIYDKNTQEVVADQGRALIILEKLVLPFGKEDFSEEEMECFLTKKLNKKGHRIQDDEEEDTELRAEEKEFAMQRRYQRVHGPGAVLPPKEESKPDMPPENPSNLSPKKSVEFSCPECHRTYGLLTLFKNLGIMLRNKK